MMKDSGYIFTVNDMIEFGEFLGGLEFDKTWYINENDNIIYYTTKELLIEFLKETDRNNK